MTSFPSSDVDKPYDVVVPYCTWLSLPSLVLQVIVALRARRPVTDPVLALELRAQDGTRVYRTTHRFELDADGTAQLAFEVSALNLLGGDYDLALGAGHGAEAALAERTIRFSVAREEGPEGIVALDGSWRSMPAAEKRA